MGAECTREILLKLASKKGCKAVLSNGKSILKVWFPPDFEEWCYFIFDEKGIPEDWGVATKVDDDDDGEEWSEETTDFFTEYLNSTQKRSNDEQ